MSKTCSVFALSILFLLAVSLSAQEVNVAGDWEITTESPRGGERTSTMHIDQEGEKITVTMESMRGGEMKGEGTVKGNEIEWTVTIESQRGEFTLTYKGKVEGDTMSGEVQMGDFGAREWKAKKK
jgi:hypothetical protein